MSNQPDANDPNFAPLPLPPMTDEVFSPRGETIFAASSIREEAAKAAGKALGEAATGAVKGLLPGRRVPATCAQLAAKLRVSVREVAMDVARLESTCPDFLTDANVKRIMGALDAIDERIALKLGLTRPETLIPPGLRAVPN